MMTIKKSMFMGILVVFINGCISYGIGTGTPTAQNPNPQPRLTAPIATQTPDMQYLLDIENAWEQGPHAQTNDSVMCSTCHQLKNGIVTSEVAWWNQVNGQYDSVNDYGNLCRNCHEGYDRIEIAHKNFTCLDCHNPHSTSASCFDCHKQLANLLIQVPSTPIGGHNNGMDTVCSGSGCHSTATQMAKMPLSIHGLHNTKVTCAACHDADGLQVGPLQDGSVWVVWNSSELDRTAITPFYSHNLQYQVSCIRCHYENNPWGLHSENTP